MCGITGLFDTQGMRPVSRMALARMGAALQHRGPDAAQNHVAPGIGLALRHLALHDIAATAQPLFDANGAVVVLCDGVIYNRKQLAQELQALGHVLHTQSDSELIGQAWLSWGPHCVQHLRGMFALVLWDRAQQTLFLARDRLGIKPLYYAFLHNGLLLFGSELKALLAHGNMPRALDPLAVEEYFALGYVAEPRTIFKAASKLAAGHTLTLRRGFLIAQPQAYWDLAFTQDRASTPAHAQAELVQRMREAVQWHMPVDGSSAAVPPGALLSGGVASSAMVALMAGLVRDPLTTCHLGLSGAAAEGEGFAMQVALRYLTRHHTQPASLEPHSAGAQVLVDALARRFDEPFADSLALVDSSLYQLARGHGRVALSASGAQASFAGYARYQAHLQQEVFRHVLAQGLRQPLFGLLGAALPGLSFDALAGDAVRAYVHTVSLNKAALRRTLFSPLLKQQLGGYSVLEVFRAHAARLQGQDGQHGDALALVQYLDFKTRLPGDTNTRADRASAALGLQLRAPLQDHALVQWLATLPTHFKVAAHQGALLLKQAMEPYLPHDLLYHPRREVALPVAAWLRGPLRQRLQQAVLGPRLMDTGYFERRTLYRLLQTHLAGAQDHSAALWSLLMFEAFLRQVVDAPPGPGHVLAPPSMEILV